MGLGFGLQSALIGKIIELLRTKGQTFAVREGKIPAEMCSSLTENAHRKNAMQVSRCDTSASGKLMPAYESKRCDRNFFFFMPWYTLRLNRSEHEL